MITTWREKNERRGWVHTIEDGINVYWLALRYSNRLGNLMRILQFLRFAIRASTKVSTIKGDVIVATSTPLTIALPAIYSSWRNRNPFVFEVRDLWPEIPIKLNALRNPLLIWFARRLEKIAYQKADQLIALSPDMARGIASVRPTSKITIIPNFCNIDSFCNVQHATMNIQQLAPGVRAPVVLYAGALGLVNNVRYLVEIARIASIRNYEICFVVVGEGREETLVRDLAERYNILNKNFFLARPVAKREMGALIQAVEISTSFVLNETALWANSANKVFDTFALGRAIAINHGGWLAEVIRESGAGIILPPADAEKSAEMLFDLLRDNSKLKKMNDAALALARERFASDRAVEKFESVLFKALNKCNN
jgi:glycosyltransferase involved in cell wall biosynthesis